MRVPILKELTNSKERYNQRPGNTCHFDPFEDLRVIWFPALSSRKYLSEQSQAGDYLDVHVHVQTFISQPPNFCDFIFALGIQDILGIPITNINCLRNMASHHTTL